MKTEGNSTGPVRADAVYKKLERAMDEVDAYCVDYDEDIGFFVLHDATLDDYRIVYHYAYYNPEIGTFQCPECGWESPEWGNRDHRWRETERATRELDEEAVE